MGQHEIGRYDIHGQVKDKGHYQRDDAGIQSLAFSRLPGSDLGLELNEEGVKVVLIGDVGYLGQARKHMKGNLSARLSSCWEHVIYALFSAFSIFLNVLILCDDYGGSDRKYEDQACKDEKAPSQLLEVLHRINKGCR